MELSLRARLALALVLLPLLSLAVLSYYVARAIKKDKVAYVYDAANGQAYSLNLQLEKSLSQGVERLKSLSYRYFNPSIEGNKPWDLGILDAFLVIPSGVMPTGGSLKFFVEVETGVSARVIKSLEKISKEEWNKIHIDFYAPCKCWILRHFDRDRDFVGLVSQAKVWPELHRAQGSTLILAKDGLLLDTNEKDERIIELLGSWVSEENKKRGVKGSFRSQLLGIGAHLVSRVSLSRGPYELWLLTPEVAVLGVVNQIFKGVFLVAIALGIISVVLAFAIADSITFGLDRLLEATVQVAHGHFGFRLPNLGVGEVGQLAKAFNTMTLEIRHLLKETAQKARMEEELKTAQLVQTTFFQNMEAKYSGAEVVAFYQSASECGGDWFYHFDDGRGSVYVVVADVTGHGVASAMATSALSVIFAELRNRHLEPNQIVNQTNKLISEVFRGSLMMTMVVLSWDKGEQILKVCNASHEPAIMLPLTEGVIKKRDLQFLDEVHGPRLGQDASVEYQQSTLKIESRSRFVLYSDGVFEIESPEREKFNERLWLNAITKAYTRDMSLFDYRGALLEHLGLPSRKSLQDDVSIVLFQVDI